MSYFWLLVAMVVAFVNWLAVEKKWKVVEYITKPGTMILLLVWLWQIGAFSFSSPMFWFVLGAAFSLAGDVFLMLPMDLFIFGLVSFLLGHVSYVVGFNLLPLNLGGWRWVFALVVILVLAVVIGLIYRRLATGLEAKSQKKMRLPVLVYALVITVMVISALLCFTRQGWGSGPALQASLGALLFYVSDSMLAWDRFVAPISHGRLKVMMTYHLGQLGILLGAALNFLLTK